MKDDKKGSFGWKSRRDHRGCQRHWPGYSNPFCQRRSQARPGRCNEEGLKETLKLVEKEGRGGDHKENECGH